MLPRSLFAEGGDLIKAEGVRVPHQADKEHQDGLKGPSKADVVCIITLGLVIFSLYGVAVYSYAHSYDFLAKINTPFELASW